MTILYGISGIPNAIGTYDDGYRPVQNKPTQSAPQPTTVYSSGLKHKVGEKVRYRSFYKSSTAPVSQAIIKSDWRNGTITKALTNGCNNPYLIDNGKCWINDGDIH